MFLEQKGNYAMNSPAQYLHLGFILISLPNLLLIALLIVVFVLAVALRSPDKQHLSTLETTPQLEEIGESDRSVVEVHS